MKLSDLHKELSRNPSYRAAYKRIGDSVILAIHFRAAREAARLTRTQLAAELQLFTGDIANVEDAFHFSNALAVSLIADRLEGHLQSFGVTAQAFFVPGGRITDLPKTPSPGPKGRQWKATDFDEAALAGGRVNLGLSRGEVAGITPDQVAILRRVASGDTAPRQAARN